MIGWKRPEGRLGAWVIIKVSLVIRHKFQLRFTPKIWHMPGVLESRDFRRISSTLHCDIVTLVFEIRSSNIVTLVSSFNLG